MTPTGIKGWSFYPTEARALHDAIVAAPPFAGLSEAAAFAHSAVIVMRAQQEAIERLERLLVAAGLVPGHRP